jgi:hypothetical protein
MKLSQFKLKLKSDPAMRAAVDMWNKHNPPPQKWTGTREDWAFEEMPLTMYWLCKFQLWLKRRDARIR